MDGKCPLFQSIEKKMDWANTNLPQLKIEDTKNFMPFMFSNKNGQKTSVKFKNVNHNDDYCFTIHYKLGQNSSLQISYNDYTPISIDRFLTPNQKENNNVWNEQDICVSYLTSSIKANTFNVSIKSDLVEGGAASIRVGTPVKKERKKMLKHLTWNRVIEDDNQNDLEFQNQWQFALPSRDEWSATSNDDITFYGMLLYLS